MRLLLLVILTGVITAFARVRADGNTAPVASNATVPAQAGVNRRDSAGISIVDVSAAFMNRLPVWRISSAPIISIGLESGAPEFLFSGMKRTAIAKLSNGTLAIVDGPLNGQDFSAEIRIFDASGRFVKRIGRRGQGPGEFTSPPDIRPLPNGGVIAADRDRVTRFDSSGKVVDTWQIRITDCPRPLCLQRGILASGAHAVYSSDMSPLSTRGARAGQTFTGLKAWYGLATRDTTRVVTSIDLPAYITLSLPPGPPMIALSRGGRAGGTAAPSTNSTMTLPPAVTPAPESAIVAGQNHFAVTLHNPFEFRIFDSSAKLVRIIRITRPKIPLTAAEKRLLVDGSSGGRPTPGRPVADYWPEFQFVRFGENDDLWVQDYHRTTGNDDVGPARFTIIGIDGIPVARLDARSNPVWKDQSRNNLHLAPSGRDAYRAITTDSLGVPRLLVFGIIK